MVGTLEYGEPKGKTVEYLNRYCLSEFRTGHVTCKDVLLPEYFTVFGDQIREMDVRPDDTWLCTYPKTGSTWTREMIWCIGNDVDLKAAERNQGSRFPFLELTALYDFRNQIHRDVSRNIHGTDSITLVNNLPSPRFVKTHLPFKLLPEKLQRNETNTKIIYVARNPRDTCISYYHHHINLGSFHGGFEEFCELFMEGNVCYGHFLDHIAGVLEQKNNPNVLILKFEDMKRDLKSVVHKTANFLGKTLNEEQEQKLLNHISFENMKVNPAVNKQRVLDHFKQFKISEAEGQFIREGKTGGWKNVMSPEMSERFEKWQDDYVRKKGLSTDFIDLIS